MAPARPKLNLAQRLLAKWAARKAGKQLRDGNPRPIYWANTVAIIAVVLGILISYFRLFIFGILAVALGVGLGISGIIKSGKNKEYAGEGLGIFATILGSLWILFFLVALVAVFLFLGL
jgi:hypothetical protein